METGDPSKGNCWLGSCELGYLGQRELNSCIRKGKGRKKSMSKSKEELLQQRSQGKESGGGHHRKQNWVKTGKGMV